VFSSSAAHAGYATVFVYHKFDEPKSPSTSITSEVFEAQLRYLQENKYNVISLHELVSYLRYGKEIPEKTVVLTIDDGYRSFFTKAFPLLKKYRLPFTIFLYMEAVGRYPDYITIDQLREIKRYSKAILGNHSYSHSRFGRWPDGMSRDEYVRWIEHDLLRSEARFEELVGYSPEYFAFPYGEYSQEYVNSIKERGYIASLTQDPASTGKFTDRFLIPRYAVVGRWATLKKIREFLETEPLRVDMVTPAYGVLKENPPSRIEGRIHNHSIYKNIGIYISELGWIKPEFSREVEGKIYIDITARLERRINRIGFSALNTLTGRRASYFYLIIQPPE
jgi:peptidoglycan/xylan/chitin deacetylase (PgdA/CDA1 family)